MNTRWRRRPIGGVAVCVVTLALQGCAALPIAALGGSAVESGVGSVVKTGTEYTMGGAVHRTFPIAMADVHEAIVEALQRTGVIVTRDELSADHGRVTGRAQHRTVRVRLAALTPALTSLTLVVKRNAFSKDRATTSELLEQTEQVLAESPIFARRLHREPSASPAASPRTDLIRVGGSATAASGALGGSVERALDADGVPR